MDSDRFDKLSAAVEGLETDIESLKVAHRDSLKPWYKNASTLFAAMAILVSLVGAVYTYFQNVDAEQRRLKDELQGIIVKLNEIPLRHLEFITKYSGDHNLQSAAGSQFSALNSTFAARALIIIDKIPHLVTAGERLTVASALMSAGEFQSALPMVEVALETATQFNEAMTAARQLGGLYFQLGDVEEGRKHFTSALKIFESGRFTPANDGIDRYSRSQTYVIWARDEGLLGNCEEWEDLLNRAKELLDTFPYHPEDPVRNELNVTTYYGCPPDASKPPPGQPMPGVGPNISVN